MYRIEIILVDDSSPNTLEKLAKDFEIKTEWKNHEVVLRDEVYVNSTKLSKILKDLGININTIPVLDVIRKNTHKVIGNRSFSNDPVIVKKLGKFCNFQPKARSILKVEHC